VGPSQSIDVPVLCVEQHRWSGGSQHERRLRTVSPLLVDAATVERVDQQGVVWERVSRYATHLGSSSTASFAEYLDRLTENPALPASAALAEGRRLRPLAGQRGLIVGLAGFPVLLEVFPSTASLAAYFQGRVAGAVLDAISSHLSVEVVPGRRARRMIAAFDSVTAQAQPSVESGCGTAFAASAKHQALHGVALNGRWAHVSVLNRLHPLLQAG
jgi:hypothetical protein